MAVDDNAARHEDDPWSTLGQELDLWAAAGREATLWWRDDDATMAGPKLDRLIAMTAAARAPLLLAAIPARADRSLAERLTDIEHVWVAQHGFAHVNHAPRGQGLGAWELGLHRGREPVLRDLEAGRTRLEALFDNRFLPVVVPPWNRIDPALFADLSRAGYHGLSAFAAREAAEPAPRFRQVNAHVDPVRWKAEGRFVGETKALGQLVDHLAARRTGRADPDEATGYLTHHIDLDDDAWAFSERLGAAIRDHPAARWCDPAALWAQ